MKRAVRFRRTRRFSVVAALLLCGCGGGHARIDGGAYADGRGSDGKESHDDAIANIHDAAVNDSEDVPAASGDGSADVAKDVAEAGRTPLDAPAAADLVPEGALSIDASQMDSIGACEVTRTLSAAESSAYTPLAVGNRWTYRGQQLPIPASPYGVEFQQRLEILGKKTIGTTEGLVISDSNPDGNATAIEEYLAVDGTGLVNMGNTAGSYPPGVTTSATPYVEVPFPVSVCSAVQQFRMGASVGTSVSRSIGATTVSGVTFSDVLRVERNVTSEERDVDGGANVIRELWNAVDWYAPGLGRIKRIVTTAGRQMQYDITGLRVGTVVHGVLPGGIVAQLDAASSSLGGREERPAIATDGNQFLVVSSTNVAVDRTSTGGLQAVLVSADGVPLGSTPLVQGGAIPVRPAVAYGDGHYLVTYPLYNAGTVKAVFIAADGTQQGTPFDIYGSGDVAVAYGNGVFLVATRQTQAIGISVVDNQGTVRSEVIPYPGQTQGEPALAYDGKNFLMTWLNTTTELPNGASTHVSAGRVNADGNAIDVSITQVTTAAPLQEEVDVTFDGTGYVISWFHRKQQSVLGEGEVRIARVGTDGKLLDPEGRVIAPLRMDTSKRAPRIARLGGQTMVVWERINYRAFGTSIWIAGTRVDSAGNAIDSSDAADGTFISLQSPLTYEVISPVIAGDAKRALVIYTDRRSEAMSKRTLVATPIFPW